MVIPMHVLFALAVVVLGIPLVMSVFRHEEVFSSPSGSSRASPKRYFGWFGSIFVSAHPIRAVTAMAFFLMMVLCVSAISATHFDLSLGSSSDIAATTTEAPVASITTNVNTDVFSGAFTALATAITISVFLVSAAYAMQHSSPTSRTGSADFTNSGGTSTFGRLRQSDLRSFVMGIIDLTSTGIGDTYGWLRRINGAVMHGLDGQFNRFGVSFGGFSASSVT